MVSKESFRIHIRGAVILTLSQTSSALRATSRNSPLSAFFSRICTMVTQPLARVCSRCWKKSTPGGSKSLPVTKYKL